MDWEHPSLGYRIFDALIGNTLLRPIYARYVAGLGLRGDERVLELGSGTGLMSRHLSAALSKPGGRLTCVDISEAMTRTARRRLRGRANVEIRVGDIRTLDIPDRSFDAAVIHFMLHDIEEGRRADTVRAVVAKIRPAGRIHIREPMMHVHGMGDHEVRAVMEQAGARKVSDAYRKVGPIMRVYDATYEVPA